MLMDLARYVVDAGVVEGRSARATAASVGMSKSWAANQVARYRAGGYEALAKRSTAPARRPAQITPALEDEVVALRKSLGELGTDARAKTIGYHLSLCHTTVPATSSIWRVLKRRGFVVPQPHKRPRSSWARFEAALPNETWQSDMTHWSLGTGQGAEVVSFIDDYSRLLVATSVVAVATAADVVACFYKAAARWGFPESVLTDNGCIYTAAYRGGRCGMETELASPRHRLQARQALPPPDPGQGRALPANPETLAEQTPFGHLRSRPTGPGGRVRLVLQRGLAPHRPGLPDTQGGLGS